MGSNYYPGTPKHGVVMSPIHSEKKRPRNEPVYSFTWFDVIVVLVSMGTYLADIVTDILVTLVYWKLDEKIWAGLTLTFLIVPSIIMQIFSTRWYVADGHKATALMFVIHLVMMGPIKRYIAVLRHGIRAKKTKRIEDYQAMYSELSDVSMLRLFESFLESAPQLVLQLYIMIKVTEDDHILTGIAAFFSLISLAWAIAAYTKALRTAAFSQDNRKKRVSWSDLALQTLWRVGMVAGRIVAMVLFATAYPAWLLGGVGIHWFLMSVWLMIQDTDFCGTWWEEKLFNATVGFIHIFCFFNMKEGKSRWRMVVFYGLTFAENSAMIILWYPHRVIGTWYNIPALVVVWGGFAIGLLSMVLYYRYFHPSSPKKCHCCMLYYHLVYRCCPCYDVTTFHGTPYRRNLGGNTEFHYEEDGEHYFGADSEEEAGDYFYKQHLLPENCELQNGGECGNSLDSKDALLLELGRMGVQQSPGLRKDSVGALEDDLELNRRQEFGKVASSRKVVNKKLLMPNPKLTSTPADELELAKMEDEQMTLSSFSRSNEIEDGNVVSGGDPLTFTPSVLKNLPGGRTGPCTDKGNSTLVREWVKKTQDIYGSQNEDMEKRGVSFAAPGTDFGTLRYANKDEKEFMAMHFGEFNPQPTGRRDILRLKSFSKKDREQPKKVKKRRSSYNVTDLRNTFREAFGFHTFDKEKSGEEECGKQGKIVRKQPKRKAKLTKAWNETNLDSIGPDKEIEDAQKNTFSMNKEFESAQKKSANFDTYSKPVNAILARIDQPPNFSERRIGTTKKAKYIDKPVIEIFDTEGVHEIRDVELGNNLDLKVEDGGFQNERFNVDEVEENVIFIDAESRAENAAEYQNIHFRSYKDSAHPTSSASNRRAHNKKAHRRSFSDNPYAPPLLGFSSSGDIRILPDTGTWAETDLDHSRHLKMVHENNPSPLTKVKVVSRSQELVKGRKTKPLKLWNTPKKELLQNNETEIKGGDENFPPIGHPIEKSLYDNLSEGEQYAGFHGNESSSDCDVTESCDVIEKDGSHKVPPNDMFGAVIQVRGDQVTVRHRDGKSTEEDQNADLISNLVFQPSRVRAKLEQRKPIPSSIEKLRAESRLISNPGNHQTVENSNEPIRRDRIEYLYKMGKQGLMKAAENSPARKRLLFNKYGEILVKNDKFSNSGQVGSRKSAENTEIPSEKNENAEMKKSIEALGDSMEGVVDDGENYKIHIHHTSMEAPKRSSHSQKKHQTNRKRSTLGSIENRPLTMV